MSIADDREYRLTCSKLANVRKMIARIEQQPAIGSPAAHAASLRSLRAHENQLFEELTRYEIAHSIRPITGRTRSALA